MEQSFSDISLYHEYRSARETEHLVSQKTWDDLNLDDFFEWADRTSSCVGRQYLYDVLHYNRLSEISEQEEVFVSFLLTRSCVQKSGRSCGNWIRRMLIPLHRYSPFPIPCIPAAFTVC